MLTKEGSRKRFIQLLAVVLVAFATVGIAVPASAATGQAHRAVARAHPAGAAAAVVEAAVTYTYSCGEPPFQGYDGPNNIFTPACNYHDACYWGGTHGYPFMGNRYVCDTTFHALMYQACWNYQWWNASCYATADLYYNIVRTVGVFYWAGNWWDNV